MSIINIIKSSPLFYELFDEEIETIVENCDVMSLEEGGYIFREGEEGNEIFLILTGGAAVKKGDVILADLKKGDLFGEMVLLDEKTRTADIMATTFTDVLVLDFDAIFGIFTKNPKIFSLLMLNLCRLLAKRLKGSGESIKGLNARIADLESQVAEFKKAA
jgi:CRP/FNR family cyclic AMP-dependent transcriptional regulator